jgi:hypothetical protein
MRPFKGKFSGIRKTAGTMNKTESRYADVLNFRKVIGKIVNYEYESIKFKLPDGSTYTPDFFVEHHNHFEFHEVKGSYNLDRLGRSKFKQAADKHPYFRWVLKVWKNKQWVTEYDNQPQGVIV